MEDLFRLKETDVGYRDLREWLDKVEELKELRRIDGADWNLEMGTIVELIYNKAQESAPAVLFDNITGYPPGYRVLFGLLGTYQRMALTLDMPAKFAGMMDFIKAYRRRVRDVQPIPPRWVESGPVMENVVTGSDVDINQFPSPFHHELDGGRYFGTGHIVITQDPVDEWVNFGTYRLMLHDQNTLGLYMSPGKHGAIHRQKYVERGEPCPVAVALGTDPLVWFASTSEIPGGLSEYDYAGGLRGEPIEVIRGPLTGLPIPANAEIALEGESYPGETRNEGPFG
ncbi:MAG: UbiD family decarboxylase, partial [Dehalococcoidia bacterium]|nr:UbiD family decarboxylase [Dehalococcoidia bacterium]